MPFSLGYIPRVLTVPHIVEDVLRVAVPRSVAPRCESVHPGVKVNTGGER